MTTATQFFHSTRSAFPGVAALRERLADAVAGWSKRRQITRELNAHTDRELADMGLSRLDIHEVARGSFRR
jgi:uncharacterized protein YjiS (DUF1127 family)